MGNSMWAYRLCIVVFLAADPAVAYGAPRVRDTWHVYVNEDAHYGSERTTVTKLADGNFQYVLQRRVLIDLFGMHQDMISRSEYVVTPAYEPVSLDVRGTQASGPIRATGRARDGKLAMSFLRAGLEHTAIFDLEAGLVFQVCLDDWLNDQPVHVTTAKVPVLLDEVWRIYPATLVRQSQSGAPAAWEFDLGMEGGKGIRVYDAGGTLSEVNFDVPKARLQRCTPAEAQAIRHFKMEGRYLLSFPIDKAIGALHLLNELVVKLTWKDLPFERFQLEDARQRVVRQGVEDDEHWAIVTIRAPEPIDSDEHIPVENLEMEPYLAETYFIKPHDEHIRATARKVIGRAKTTLAATEALSEWVFANIEPARIAETLTGPEVLQLKKGKCSEYATLFASLARSAGIPTRIVLGERMGGGQYVGHMWNEAYVGEWITVDTAANEVGRSFALLKLTHSDSVLGTAALRWALTEGFDIQVQDAKAVRSPLAEGYETGVAGRVLTDIDHACRFTAPLGWTIEETSKLCATAFRFHALEKEHEPLLELVVFSLPPGSNPKALMNARIGFQRPMHQGFELMRDEPREVKDARGHLCQFQWKSGERDEQTIKTTEVLWVQEASGFLLRLRGEEAIHDGNTAVFAELLMSYEHLVAD